MIQKQWHYRYEETQRKKSRRAQSWSSLAFSAFISLCLLSLSLPSVSGAAYEPSYKVNRTVVKSNSDSTASEGLLLEAAPTYIDFKGDNGLELEISLPRSPRFDYTLMFWFRSSKSLDELIQDEAIKNTKAYIFKMKNSVGCYITREESEDSLTTSGPWLRCEIEENGEKGVVDQEILLSKFPDIQSWMHLTYTAQYNQASKKSTVESFSNLRIDISSWNLTVKGKYGQIRSRRVFYGCGSAVLSGFAGNYRQFYISLGYLNPENVVYLMHQYKVLDYSTMAYYKFINNIFINQYEDAFRDQGAQAVNILPDFRQETTAAPFCNSIPQKQVRVPQFFRSGGNKFESVRIPRFKYLGRQIGYTASFWMKNYGQHAFSANPAFGRDKNHIFRLDDSFALWYDSQTSFRVYVYAKNNWEETYSDPVFLPMHEWINIQVALSQNSGITIMTFNQNGERQQLVQNKVFLGEQYPSGTVSLFNSFIGIPYRLSIWEKFIELPTNDDSQDGLIVSYDFNDSKYAVPDELSSFEGWKTLVLDNGEDLAARQGDGFDFIWDNIPSNVNFKKPSTEGQLSSTTSAWNVTCPAPETSLMYLSGQGAKFDMSILVEKTGTYTVEFWFKAAVSEYASVDQGRTFLFMMDGRSENLSELNLQKYTTNVMVIYVEENELRCAPFGFVDGEPKDPESILKYSGIDPLAESKWQHISCIYLNQQYVKGQYLAIDLNEASADTFEQDSLRPQTFAKSIYKSEGEILNFNMRTAQRWTIILGNDPTFSKIFYGSFKDVRVWKSERSDAELFTNRFNQVDADVQKDLQGNLKFMDGNRDVYNTAETNTSGPKYPKNEPNMQLLPTDLTNIICATDTYFNPAVRECTRYPYTKPPSIVYLVINNVQHGHQMILTSLVQSTMFLPGEKYQPKTATKWSVTNKPVDDEYFLNRSRSFYNLDPIFMGDNIRYTFRIEMNDVEKHNFYLTMDQIVTPRKCIQVVDKVNTTPSNQVLRKLNDKKEDLEFEFLIKRIDGCADEFQNKLHPKVVIETQPPIPQDIIDQFLQQPDTVNNKFKVIIPSAVLENPDMPKNIPIDMIFIIFWSSSELKNEESYMNIVYKVTLSTEINVDMQYGGSKVIDLESGTDLAISASCSHFYNAKPDSCTDLTSSQGLSFRWECAKQGENLSTALADYCHSWNGSSKMVMPSKIIESSKMINKPLAIKVIVTSIEASEQTDDSARTILEYEQYYNFTWVNTVVPQFTITLPSEFDSVLVSVQQEISIVPLNWIASSAYKIGFILYDIEGEQKLVSIPKKEDDSSTRQIIPADTLEYNKDYQIVVDVQRIEASDEALKQIVVNDKNFTTGNQPDEPSVQIEPLSGIMYDTEFTITVSSENPVGLKYVLYGVLNDDSEIRLTDEYVDLNGANEYTNQLPQVKKIIAEVRNAFGEIRRGNQTVTVDKTEEGKTVSWVQVLRGRTSDSKADLWQQFQFIAQDANADAMAIAKQPDSKPEEIARAVADAKQVNFLLATRAFTEIKVTPNETTDPDEKKKVERIVNTIKQMSVYGEFMVPIERDDSKDGDSLYILQKSVETLEYVTRIEDMMQLVYSDKVQRTSLVTALGQLMEITATRAQVAKAIKKYYLAKESDSTITKPNINWIPTADKKDNTLRRLQSSPQDDLQQESLGPINPLYSLPNAIDQVGRILQDDADVDSSSTEVVVDENILSAPEIDENEITNQIELDGFRDLLRKIIVIKNDLVDQLCSSLSPIAPTITINTPQLELVVKRWLRDTTKVKDNTFESQETKTKVQAPVEGLLRATRVNEASIGAEWVCMQVSFMRPNPAAGFEPDNEEQFFFEGQDIIQLGSIDSKGVRLMDENDQNLFKDDFVTYTFQQTPENMKHYFEGWSICGQYDGNNPQSDRAWTNKKFDEKQLDKDVNKVDCEQKENFTLNTIACTCQYVTNFYYTVVTDTNLARKQPKDIQDETHFVLGLIFIPLVLVGLVFPCIMVYLDAQDYQGVEDHIYPVDDLTIAKLERARNYLCKQQIYYNEKEIARYMELNDGDFRSGSAIAFATFHRTLHPYFSLFTRFDYRMKRLTRFSFVLFQISLITVLMWIAYSIDFEIWVSDPEGMVGIDLEKYIAYRWFYLSLLLSVLTIPMPLRCCFCFKTQMYLLNDESRHPLYIEDDDDETEITKVVKNYATDVDEEENEMQKNPAMQDNLEEFVRPALFDRCLQCKLVGIVLFWLFWLFTLGMTAILAVYSGNDEVKEGLEHFVELTPSQASEFVMVWYLSIFVWGVLLNELRIVIISLLAPIQAQAIFDRKWEIWNNTKSENQDKTQEQIDEEIDAFEDAFCTKVSCATIALIPPESVEIALDAIFTIDIKTRAEKEGLDNDDNDDVQYQVKKEFRDLFQEAAKYKKIKNDKTKDQTNENGQSMANPVKGGGETEMATLKTKKKKQSDIQILSPGDPQLLGKKQKTKKKSKSKKTKTTGGE